MYLFIYADKQVRQVNDNLTIADILAVKQKILKIFTVDQDIALEIIVDNDKLCKVIVPETRILKTKQGRIHHP